MVSPDAYSSKATRVCPDAGVLEPNVAVQPGFDVNVPHATGVCPIGLVEAAEVIVTPPRTVAAPLMVACALTDAAQSRIKLKSLFILETHALIADNRCHPRRSGDGKR